MNSNQSNNNQIEVIHDTEKDQNFDVFIALCEVLNGLDQLKKRIE